MKVKLVSYSQPTEEFRQQNIDDALDLVAYCARVSNPANQFNTETINRTLKFSLKGPVRTHHYLNTYIRFNMRILIINIDNVLKCESSFFGMNASIPRITPAAFAEVTSMRTTCRSNCDSRAPKSTSL